MFKTKKELVAFHMKYIYNSIETFLFLRCQKPDVSFFCMGNNFINYYIEIKKMEGSSALPKFWLFYLSD